MGVDPLPHGGIVDAPGRAGLPPNYLDITQSPYLQPLWPSWIRQHKSGLPSQSIGLSQVIIFLTALLFLTVLMYDIGADGAQYTYLLST